MGKKKAINGVSKVKHNKELPIEQHNDTSEIIGITRSTASSSGSNPYVRDTWNEGNWNADRPYDSVPWNSPQDIITMCWNSYLWEPIVGNVIDLMTDFSVEGIEIQHQNKSVQAFLNNWWMLIKGNRILNNIFHDIFRGGMCMVQKRTSLLDKSLQTKISQIAGSLDERKFPLPINNLSKREIPQQYFTYDPRSIRVYGDETVGSVSYYIVLDQNSISAMFGEDRAMMEENIKNKTLLRKGTDWLILLPKDKITYIPWRKASYSKYGLPFTTRILEALLVKRKFFNMLRGASDNWLSAIRIWKLGQQKGGPETAIAPNPNDYKKLAKLVKSLQPGASLDIIWNWAIELSEHYAPVKDVFSSVPMDLINKEIKFGLGVPDVLIDGSGGNFANAFLAIKSLVERLEYARELVMSEFLIPELYMLSESLGFRRLPIVKFGHMNLRDEATILKLIVALRDRKLISKDTLLRDFDYDWGIEAARILEEDAQIKKKGPNPDDPFKDYGPFFVEKDISGIGGKGTNPGAKGRPSGKTNKNTKKRNSSPKGQKTVSDNELPNNELMYTEAPAILENCVRDTYNGLVKKYTDKHGKAPSTKDKKDLKSSAYAICTNSLKKAGKL